MDVKNLAITAAKGRLLALQCVYEAASGHPGGSLSAMDLLTVLYFDTMCIDPKNPQDPNRDRFVLSKGHCTPGPCIRSWPCGATSRRRSFTSSAGSTPTIPAIRIWSM